MATEFVSQFRLRAMALEPRILAVTHGLSPAQLAATPPAGGWSIAQVFEHLCQAGDAYDPVIARALDAARKRTGPPREFRATLLGALLRKALMESNRSAMKTPKSWEPIVPRAGLVERLIEHTRRTEARLLEAEGLDVRGMLASPLAWFLRMNLAEALAIEVVHAERHLGQAERARVALKS